MEITEGTLLKVDHERKGTFRGRAMRDFDTKDVTVMYWPLVAAEDVRGASKEVGWPNGTPIPCRASMVKSFEVLEE